MATRRPKIELEPLPDLPPALLAVYGQQVLRLNHIQANGDTPAYWQADSYRASPGPQDPGRFIGRGDWEPFALPRLPVRPQHEVQVIWYGLLSAAPRIRQARQLLAETDSRKMERPRSYYIHDGEKYTKFSEFDLRLMARMPLRSCETQPIEEIGSVVLWNVYSIYRTLQLALARLNNKVKSGLERPYIRPLLPLTPQRMFELLPAVNSILDSLEPLEPVKGLPPSKAVERRREPRPESSYIRPVDTSGY